MRLFDGAVCLFSARNAYPPSADGLRAARFEGLLSGNMTHLPLFDRKAAQKRRCAPMGQNAYALDIAFVESGEKRAARRASCQTVTEKGSAEITIENAEKK